jgi:predicted site-specific integrase-resolvase
VAASKPFQLVDCPISPRHICRMAIIGYARVSTVGQNLDVQIQQLTEHGCDRIFQEKVSGTKIDRPQLQEAPLVASAEGYVSCCPARPFG